MINLSKSGNTIVFEFVDNGHYLQNGTIEVPLNSLTLVTDESDMFTFKKSATNDIFVSGLYSEIGMTKSELETFYKDNMVGSTGGSGGVTSGEVQSMIDESISGKVDTSAITSSVTSASTDSEIPTAKAVWEAASGGGSTYTAGRGIDITNDTISFKYDIGQNDDSKNVISILGFPYVDKTICTNTYSDTINNVFIGGNNQISGKSNRLFASNTIIGVNNVISATSISSTNLNSGENIILGDSNKIVGSNLRNATAIGSYNSGNTSHVLVCGYYNISNNEYESSFGKFNNSVSGSSTFGDSGNTLFSVGNGAYENRHNAFEIRQNGDIYITSGGTDIKLQDNLGGSSITVDTALDSGSTNPVENRVIYNKIDDIEDRIAEDEEVTSAALNALNDTIGNINSILESI